MSKPKTELLIRDLRWIGHNPPRTLSDAFLIARQQAKKLLLLTHTYQPPVAPVILTADPKIELRYTGDLRRVSGLCRWVGWRYVIAVNKREPVPRQRFTIFHEFKHAVDGARTTDALGRFTREGKRPAAEFVADYFASHVLIPEPWLLEALKESDDVGRLAERFGVSRDAMRVRLENLGLDRAPNGAKVVVP